jgi:cytochrome c oxidase subunit 2
MMKLLIVIVIVLGILAVAQLVRVYEITSRLRGKREEDISAGDNRMNARLMWLFPFAYFGFFLWLVIFYRNKMLPISASDHGVQYDQLMDFNWYILITVFAITNILLFYFSGKYVFNKERRAYWQPHNNKLELLWTVVPAAVLAVIIIYGLTAWNNIMTPASPDAVQVEVYGKQFDWTVRYPGKDGVLGATDYRLINATNPLGIVTPESIELRLQELATSVAESQELLKQKSEVLPPSKIYEIEGDLGSMQRMQQRIINLRTMMQQDITDKGNSSVYLSGADDIVTKEFMLPVHHEANMLIRSRDVIHSVYIPHMRAQMNAVPGMTTYFKFTPSITTDSMRTHVMKDDKFDYILLCNKICGASHYNMQMPLVVVEQAEYDKWYADQQGKPFQALPGTAEVNKQLPTQQGDSTQVQADTVQTATGVPQ